MDSVFDLAATFTLDSSDFESGLSRITTAVQNFGNTVQNIINGIGKISTAFVDGAKSTAAYGDNVDKMSQKIGISAQAYQEWAAVMEHCGTSIDTMQQGMKTLSTAVEGGSDKTVEAFKAIGLTMEQVAGMSQEELFGAVISGLQNMEAGTERTATAATLLGRSATEMGALLNTSAEDTERMIEDVHRLGGVMSDEAVSAAAQFQDSLQNMNTAFEGLKNGLMSEFLPAMSEVMDGLAQVFSGDSGGLAVIQQGIQNFGQQLQNVIPTFMQIGQQILTALIQGISQNMPYIAQMAVMIVQQLVQGIRENIPVIVNAFAQMIAIVAQQLPTIILESFKAISFNIGDAILGLFGWGSGGGDTAQLEQVGIGIAQGVTTGYVDGMQTYMPQAVDGSISTLTTSMQQFSTTAQQGGGASGQAFAQGYGQDAATGLQQANTQVESTMNQTMTTIATNAEQAGAQTGEAFGQGMQQIDAATQQTMQSVTADFQQSCAAINSAMENVDSSTLNHLNNMVSQFVNAGNSFASAMQSSGTAMVSAITNSLSQMASAFSSSLSSINSTVSTWGSNLAGQFNQIGANIVKGMINGINAMKPSLTSAINSMTANTVNQAQSSLGIHSPSKVFADQVGQYIPKGVAEGIANYAAVANSAINAMSNGLIGSYNGQTAVAGMNTAALEAQMGSMNALLGQYLPNMGGDLYMDGDKVGERVAGKVDKILGRKQIRLQRGGTR